MQIREIHTNFMLLLKTIKYYMMKLFNFFMYDVDGENVPNVSSEIKQPNQQVEKVVNKATQAKKLNLWQRIKKELQAWSNKDADDSAYDDTQV